MPTDLAAFRARLLDERAAVVAEIATIDANDERAKFEAAEATFLAAQRQFQKSSRRWGLVNEKQERLTVLDGQIDLITP